MSTAAPNRSAVLCIRMDQGLGGCSTKLLLQRRNWSQQAATGVRRVMLVFCEVTQGVGDT